MVGIVAGAAMVAGTLLVLSGCASPIKLAAGIAGEAGMEMLRFDTESFRIVGFHRPGAEGGELAVVIEGDGPAWRNRYTPPLDPSPRDPVGLRVAAVHPTDGAVLYLARPCQFTGEDMGRCDVRHWTDWRFHPAAIDAMNDAIDQYLRGRDGETPLLLIGHSGGGVMAALIAARRRDVARVVTMAAPLDIDAWIAHHELTPLEGSVSPMSLLPSLRAVPQTHFVGERDCNVPPPVVRSYTRALGRASPVSTRVIAGQEHECCWPEVWPDLFIGVR